MAHTQPEEALAHGRHAADCSTHHLAVVLPLHVELAPLDGVHPDEPVAWAGGYTEACFILTCAAAVGLDAGA